MPAIRKILVPIKEPRQHVLPSVMKAAQLARASGASLELLHVLTADMYPAPLIGTVESFKKLEMETRQAALRQLESIADGLREHSIKVSVSAVWDFPAHEAIIRRARQVKADLIVASQHAGRHRLPWLLRLTDWELIRLSPVPVLLVKNPHAYRRPVILAAIDPSRAHEKPTSLDRDILKSAAQWSKALRGKLHAVHAYQHYAVQVPAEALTPGLIEKLERNAQAQGRRDLQRVAVSQRVARKYQHLSSQPPAHAISAVAKEIGSTIVVMGAISRAGIKRFLIGNTAERVLDSLTCDVLVLKPRRFVTRIPKKARGAPFGMASSYAYPMYAY